MKGSCDSLTHYSFIENVSDVEDEYRLLAAEGSRIVLGGWDLNDAHRQLNSKKKLVLMRSTHLLNHSSAQASISNRSKASDDNSVTDSNILFACGLHPWKLKIEQSQTQSELQSEFQSESESEIESGIEAQSDAVFYLKSHFEGELQSLERLVPEFDLIGEIGIDSAILSTFSLTPDEYKINLESQITLFQEQLLWARKYLKPSILHVVRSHGLVLDLIGTLGCGYVHGFSGSIETARDYIRRGMYISVGRQTLNPKSLKLRRTLSEIDLNYLLLESDFPHSPLGLHRENFGFSNLSSGQRSNQSSGQRSDKRPDQKSDDSLGHHQIRRVSFSEVAIEVARIRNLSVSSLVKKCHENFIRMMGNV